MRQLVLRWQQQQHSNGVWLATAIVGMFFMLNFLLASNDTTTALPSALHVLTPEKTAAPSTTTTVEQNIQARAPPLLPEPATWTRNFPPHQVDYSSKIHFTHVFSSFSVPESKTSQFREIALVQYSWFRAAEFAKRTRGIQVEFIDCTLPNDLDSSPSFATRYNLSWLAPDVRNERPGITEYVPTIGEYYKIAVERGRGEYVIATNLDIGVMEDFYVRAYDWASRDYTTPEAQMDAARSAAEVYAACFFATKLDSALALHQRICAEDAKQVFQDSGGYLERWESNRHEVALYACRLALKQNGDIELTWLNKMIKNLGVTLPPFRDKSALFKFELTRPSTFIPVNAEAKYFAGTITRLDMADASSIFKARNKEQAYRQVINAVRSAGDIHPGNDCFVATRLGIPRALQRFPHPTGIRPFGIWIPLLFVEVGIPFRRISATRGNAWTFHVGKGLWGGNEDRFKERFLANPVFFLFLAGNFNLLSETRVLEWHFSKGVPEVCSRTVEAYRQTRYCANAVCMGSVRPGCEWFQNANLRDGKLYYTHCSVLHSSVSSVKEPVCSFCNFIFKLHGSSSNKRFTCLPGRMDQYCQHLPEETCSSAGTTSPTITTTLRLVTSRPTKRQVEDDAYAIQEEEETEDYAEKVEEEEAVVFIDQEDADFFDFEYEPVVGRNATIVDMEDAAKDLVEIVIAGENSSFTICNEEEEQSEATASPPPPALHSALSIVEEAEWMDL